MFYRSEMHFFDRIAEIYKIMTYFMLPNTECIENDIRKIEFECDYAVSYLAIFLESTRIPIFYFIAFQLKPLTPLFLIYTS